MPQPFAGCGSGEALVLTDGRGGAATATVTASGRGELTLQVDPASQRGPTGGRGSRWCRRCPRVSGASSPSNWPPRPAWTPWCRGRRRAASSVGRRTGRRTASAKWRATAAAAAKQSRRTFVPAVAELATTQAVTDLIRRAAAAIVLHESATSPLQGVDLPAAGDVVVIVGPEGGLTEEELTVFAAAGAVPVRLGPQVLRTSTAGAVALGALGVLTGRWT